MMKKIAPVILIFISLASQAQNFQKDCEVSLKFPEVNRLEWLKDALSKIEYQNIEAQNDYLKISFGQRSQVFLLASGTKDCKGVSQALQILKKVKQGNIELNGVVLVFSDNPEAFKQATKDKTVLRDYVLPAKNSSDLFLKQIVQLDKNPVDALDFGIFSSDIKKINGGLKKVIDEKHILIFKDKFLVIKDKVKTWSLDKALKVKSLLEKHPPLQTLNDRVTDYENHIAMFDKLRRGLWEDAQKEMGKLKSVSPQLKAEMEKGINNLEEILKQSKVDIQNIEKDIQTTFKQRNAALESALQDEK